MDKSFLVLDIPDTGCIPGCRGLAMGTKRSVHRDRGYRNMYNYYKCDPIQKGKMEVGEYLMNENYTSMASADTLR
jgi:hypothetical protein